MMVLEKDELLCVLASILILALSVSFLKGFERVIFAILGFAVLVFANVLVKKAVAYSLEMDLKEKFWTVYRYGLRNDAHFKEPLPMFWVPIFFSLLTNAYVWWLAILKFDLEPRPERIARRHGRYRFTRVTEWDAGLVAAAGVFANILLAIVAFLFSFPEFAKLNVYFAAWNLVPISDLDGSKIIFGSRGIWFVLSAVVFVMLVLAFSV